MAAQICKNCKYKEETCYCSPNSTCSHHKEVDTKHTVFDKINSMNIDELAKWLDEYGAFDDSPWINWFNEKYCKNCPDIICKYEDGVKEFPCSYCELNNKCKFFPEYDETPNNETTIKMWLESEVE